jgi:hypothetical protein
MTLILSGTDGLSDVDGSAATPAIRGTDANTGIFFGTDIIGFSEGGVEAMRIDASGNVGIGGTVDNHGGYERCLQISATAGAVLELEDSSSYSYLAQNGTTLQIRNNATAGAMTFATVSTERARFNATGALVFAGGTTTADGIGITFPATQSASTNANTLDDYEEGTWTVSTATSGYTIAAQSAYYTKIGNVVHIIGKVTFSAVNGSSNSAVIFNGLPFTNNGNTAVPGVARDNSVSGAIYLVNAGVANTTLELNSMDGVSSGSQRTIRINESYILAVSYFV